MRVPTTRFGILPLLPLLVAAPGDSGGVIVIRHDRADSLYLQLGARFDAVGRIGRAGDGTLIAPRWVLTAAHVARGIDPARVRVVFGADTFAIERTVAHPEWQPMGPHDIGMIELTRPVPGITPLRLYTGDDEVGRTAILVGHGDTRSGLGGAWVRDGLRRAATNRVEAVRRGRLVFRFDEPPDATELEGIPGRGDSGGPALLEESGYWAVAGVSSAGMDGRFGPGTYGAEDHFTRVAEYAAWIADQLGGDRR